MPAHPSARPASAAAGIGLAVAGFLLLTVQDTIVKLLSGYPLHQIVFFSSVFSLVPVFAAWRWMAGPPPWRTRRRGMHLLRAAIALGSAFGAFFAYGRMPLADVYAILFAAPLFITALSVPMLGETVGWRRWTAVVVGFIGVVVMLRPGRGLLDPGILGALAASLCFSVGSLMVRQMSRTETTASFLFHFSLTGGLLTGVMLLFDAAPAPPRDVALMITVGLVAGTALFLLFLAFALAPAAVVAPFQYTQMIWGGLAGYLVFRDVPEPHVLAGGGIVAASGLYILRREIRRGTGPGTPLPEKPRR